MSPMLPQFSPASLQAIVPMADVSLLHESSRAVDQAAKRSRCACGAATPLGVRLFLRSRHRPMFEGRWSCGAACLRQAVQAAVAREASTATQAKPHRHRIPLGLVLLVSGAVSHFDLRRSLALQRDTSDRIGDVLMRSCGITERQITRAVAVQWNCALWNVGGMNAGRMARVTPRALVERCGGLPLRVGSHGRLSLAFAHAVDAQFAFALQRMHSMPVDCGIAVLSAWDLARERWLAAENHPVSKVTCEGTAGLQHEIAKTLRRMQPVQSQLVRVHEMYWLRLWLEPAAVAGGPTHAEDALDFLFTLTAAGEVA